MSLNEDGECCMDSFNERHLMKQLAVQCAPGHTML